MLCKIKRIVFLLFLTFLAFSISCTSLPESEPEEIQPVSHKLETMTLREKIGQLFIIRPESLDPSYSLSQVHFSASNGSTKVNERMKDTYINYPAGGFILFGKNVISPSQVREFTKNLHNLSDLKPLICVDEEGGPVARLAKNPNFSLPKYNNMKTIGDTKDEDIAYQAGITIGNYLHEYGFDVDFAPIADVNTNPKNPVIGVRSFSSDPQTAGKMALAFSDGLKKQGVIPCMKHFPGHGDTKTDSHSGYAETLKTWDQLLNCEMIPFKMGIEEEIPFIMTAHITVPKVENEKIPSTLSNVILTEKLRNELGYKGLIITDAMEMGAITSQFTPAQAVIKAIEAGVDIILIPYNYKLCFDTLVEAVEKGEITEERINESVERILLLKSKYQEIKY